MLPRLPAALRGSHLFKRKSLARLQVEAGSEGRLRRVLGPVQLTAMGIGAVIGAGIFVATGAAARVVAGPALMVSYGVAAATCVLAALCYAEFAAMVPVAGSAYTYAYATLGELFAWIIGWDLILEYGVSSAAVATGWSAYAQAALAKTGLAFPPALGSAPWRYDAATGALALTGSLVNLPAILVAFTVTCVLVKGIRESSSINTVMVFIKVAAVLFVIAAGAALVDAANWHPFAPFGWTGLSFFGHTVAGQVDAGGRPVGMLAGAAIIFFAYIGFDAISTHAEEARNPRRDVPLGIILSLAVCSLLYIGVAAVLTGMVRFDRLDMEAPVSLAFKARGLGWAEGLIAVAGVAGISSVLLVMMLSGPRVFLAMARDGLLPRSLFADVHPRYRTPWKSTLLTGGCVSLLAGLLPVDFLLHLTNIGTLFAFAIVCIAVPIMRRLHPEAERPFRCPFVPVVPVLGAAACMVLMLSLPSATWLRLAIWLLLGLGVYLAYGRRHSLLRQESRARAA
jgi:basic amino acid/polyamine antiporter, APA family